MNPFRRPALWVDAWATSSQQQARRNAMIASTALAQRRAERVEVEEFLETLTRRREPDPVQAETPAPAAHG